MRRRRRSHIGAEDGRRVALRRTTPRRAGLPSRSCSTGCAPTPPTRCSRSRSPSRSSCRCCWGRARRRAGERRRRAGHHPAARVAPAGAARDRALVRGDLPAAGAARRRAVQGRSAADRRACRRRGRLLLARRVRAGPPGDARAARRRRGDVGGRAGVGPGRRPELRVLGRARRARAVARRPRQPRAAAARRGARPRARPARPRRRERGAPADRARAARRRRSRRRADGPAGAGRAPHPRPRPGARARGARGDRGDRPDRARGDPALARASCATSTRAPSSRRSGASTTSARWSTRCAKPG